MAPFLLNIAALLNKTVSYKDAGTQTHLLVAEQLVLPRSHAHPNTTKHMTTNFIFGALFFIMGGFVTLFIGQAIYMEIEGVRKHGWRFLCGSDIAGDEHFETDDAHKTTESDPARRSEMQRLPKPNAMSDQSTPVLICAFGILAAFFMPWVQIMGAGMSGYNLGQLGSYGNYAWLIPILAGGTILLSFAGINNRGAGAFTGIVPLGALAYGLLRLSSEGGADATNGVFQVAEHVLSIGVYLTIIFSVAIIIAAFVRKHVA